ncbi:MAG TPA: PDZ domain-containing protein [Tepidisphaeraceae bacterium]|nr:PDZ domain-containing protein [Tepidisphaeraceae bacterium]
MRYVSLFLAVCLVSFITSGAATADDRAAVGWWRGENVSAAVFEANRTLVGHLTLNNLVLPFTDAGVEGTTLRGKFTHNGKEFPFTIELADEQATLKSGATVKPLKLADRDPFAVVGHLLEAKDYPAVWTTLNPLIEREVPHALYIAGLGQSKGWGTPANDEKALSFYLRATDLGSKFAPLNAGNMLRDGKGAPADQAKAFKLYQTSAMRGDSVGALNAGGQILNGKLGPSDDAEGCAWLLLSNEPDAKAALVKITPKLTPEQTEKMRARHAQLLQQRTQTLAGGPATGTIHMTLELKDGKPTLTAFPANGALAKFGSQPGDVLIAVDNMPTAEKSLAQIQAMLDGRAGSMIQVKFNRGGGNQILVAPREEKVAAVPAPTPPPTPAASAPDGAGGPADAEREFATYARAALLGDEAAAFKAGELLFNWMVKSASRQDSIPWLMLSRDPRAAPMLGVLLGDMPPESYAKAHYTYRALLRQREAARNIPPNGTVRMTLEMKDGKPVLASAPKGERVDRAGIRPGDVLVSVDGVPVAGKSLDEVRGLLAGGMGSLAAVRFERDGAFITLDEPRDGAEPAPR